ncbi:MAG: N-6 DNA methylase [Ktedonobacteraceae bacterium]|nr:N-6 DNA methylase [Ktedonobacteraceae bacterium]
MLLNTLLNELHYDESAHYHSDMGDFELALTHLFRAARNAGVRGIYVFNTSPSISDKGVADCPAVYIAQAEDVNRARRLHRSLWNLGYVPYLIILLPDQIRVYTGFNYSWKDEKEGFLDDFSLDNFRLLLAEFSSEAIDTGRIWQNGKYKDQLDQGQRVDRRLLENLRQLGKELKSRGLPPSVAHALIGKYVYFRYLWDRGILTEEWLQEQRIAKESVLSRMATVDGLTRLTTALESRFNGKIFPIDFMQQDAPTDLHIQLTASVFMGDETVVSQAEKTIQQLHLDFQAYDFEYIPIEILSAVYEQFIKDSVKKGAIYTPEILADYLLSEVNVAKPLTEETKILDPACGSGVFLVLAFRRLIEAELLKDGDVKLSPEKLKELLSNLYGVEKELDACYVAEFSLILTFLNYVDPRELQNIEFRFPVLHNKKIFHSDFFDTKGAYYDGKFWQQGLKFDWIIGNPPWIEVQGKVQEEQALAKQWMSDPINKAKYPVGGNRLAEAFSWVVTDLLLPEGVVGFLLPATSLFNLESRNYRKRFFALHRIFRITNFSNLRQVLFPNNTYPAFTIVYCQANETEDNKPPIIHYAPLAVNQITGSQEKPWVITINEQEIQTVNSSDAETGETFVWKLALWGTFQDKRAIERIEALFPSTLEALRIRKKWAFSQGSELRDKGLLTKYRLRTADELKGKKIFQREAMRKSLFRFSVPLHALSNIPDEMCNIRKQGGEVGLLLTQAPHIILSPSWGSFVTFSDVDFLVPPRVMGIAGPKEDANTLRALSTYLSSNLVSYYLFFHAQEWGVFRQAKYVSISEVKKIPVPNFTPSQIEELVDLHQYLVNGEEQSISEAISKVKNEQLEFLNFDQTRTANATSRSDLLSQLPQPQKKQILKEVSAFHASSKKKIDEKIFDLFGIPDDIRLLVTEFVQMRLSLDEPSKLNSIIREPNETELLDYALELRDELDDFVADHTHHGITITYSRDLIECIIEVTDSDTPIAIDSDSVRPSDLTSSLVLSELSKSLREQISQWMYVQRGLRLFDGPRIHLYKLPRLIDWTRTQAMNDAGDIVEEVIGSL